MNKIQEQVSLKEHTSYKIGGKARYFVVAQSKKDVVDVLNWSKEHQQSLYILGRGSNILISDQGWDGLVIDLSGMTAVEWSTNQVVCECGVLLHTFVIEAVNRGVAGLEQLAGIPGSVGGAVIMNAGAFGQTISDHLVSVEGIDQSTAQLWKRSKADLDFGYRTSSLKNQDALILSARFTLPQGDQDALKAKVSAILEKRKAKQPIQHPSCGSVFKRPPGNYAGALIEQCGLKGYRIGSAQISEKHANFIINDAEATAENVRALIAHAQKRVFESSGVLLEPEVIFVGQFDTPLYAPPKQ